MTVTVVCGPPCAGKTTYVQQHAQADDLVIDSDLIARELGSHRDHFHHPSLKPAIRAEWTRRIELAPTWHNDVWIVRALPQALLDVPLTIPYQVVELWPPTDVLMARAAARRHSKWQQSNIRKWLTQHDVERSTYGSRPDW